MGSLFPGKYSQWDNTFLPIVEAYLELVENLRWSLFAKIDNGEKLLTIFVKSPM